MPSSNIQELTPWYAEYRAEFMRMLSFGEHEALDHPVAAIWVLPADVTHPVSHVEALMAQAPTPPLMQPAPLGPEAMYPLKDREFPRHVVLLHDVAGGMDDKRSAENLAALRKAFGEGQASLLRLNSGAGDRGSMGATPEFFKREQHGCVQGGGAGEPAARPPAPPNGLGAYLSVTDLDAVGDGMSGWVGA